LCADRQMTKEGGLKYQETKIHWRTSLAREKFYNVVFTYCGNPDVARNFFAMSADALGDAVGKAEPGMVGPAYFMDALRPVFKSKDSKKIETLIALQTVEPCFLFRTHGDQVMMAGRECIGVGDSSVLRFFSDITSGTFIDVHKATALAIYMVSLANRYIDGCGFGADAAILRRDKPMRIMSKADTAKYSDSFFEFEKEMEKNFYPMCVPIKTKPGPVKGSVVYDED